MQCTLEKLNRLVEDAVGRDRINRIHRMMEMKVTVMEFKNTTCPGAILLILKILSEEEACNVR